jgi:hypothetical protein
MATREIKPSPVVADTPSDEHDDDTPVIFACSTHTPMI